MGQIVPTSSDTNLWTYAFILPNILHTFDTKFRNIDNFYVKYFRIKILIAKWIGLFIRRTTYEDIGLLFIKQTMHAKASKEIHLAC
jgi:hypothetical protein